MIVPAEWHNNPSAQRQSSAYPSTQRWSSACFSAQMQSSAYPLGRSVMSYMVGPRPWIARWGTLRASHPTEVVMVSSMSSLWPHHAQCDWHTLWLQPVQLSLSSCRDSGGASKAVTGNGFLHRQAITCQKPGVGATSCVISRGPVSDVESCFVSSTS